MSPTPLFFLSIPTIPISRTSKECGLPWAKKSLPALQLHGDASKNLFKLSVELEAPKL